MTANLYRTTPHGTADSARLTGASHLDCKISTEESGAAITSSKTTAPASRRINKLILSHLPGCALQRLRDIFSAALSTGYFPYGVKGAQMRLIPKPGKPPTRPENYRPIFLLEMPGKMLGRVMGRRLRNHLDGEDLLNEAKSGFRRGRGTSHAIPVATETLAIHQVSLSRYNLVLRDISRAFDRV